MRADQTETGSDAVVYEFTVPPTEWKRDRIRRPKQLLRWMRSRVEVFGTPLPEGYVPPPGIDIAALLKEVPWPPPANNG